MTLADRFWNAAYRVPWLRKPGAFRYCKQHYPQLTYMALNAMWKRAAAEPEYDSMLGGTVNVVERFFTHIATWRHEASDEYRCVEGCCVVVWFNGRNTGGWGRPGCPCDEMEDPRGELIRQGSASLDSMRAKYEALARDEPRRRAMRRLRARLRG